jgi:hypothetical protein
MTSETNWTDMTNAERAAHLVAEHGSDVAAATEIVRHPPESQRYHGLMHRDFWHGLTHVHVVSVTAAEVFGR